ncbi:hypothetical protein LTR41_011705 [Exophiala xenobiotica]|nr:hypothetical protein LTR41_011705 [Exophiala xenobiotica]
MGRKSLSSHKKLRSRQVRTRTNPKHNGSSTSPGRQRNNIVEKPSKPQPLSAGIFNEAQCCQENYMSSLSRATSNPLIFTIGHGTRSRSELTTLLRSAQVTKLVDVRSIPRSRTNPQFNRDTLTTSSDLRAAGIEYIWAGESLGGRRPKSASQENERHTAVRVQAFKNYAGYMSSESFREGLGELKKLAEGNTVAIMCSETLWWRCHRRMISDRLVTDGWEVRHLGIQKIPIQHQLWEIAHFDGQDLIYDGR